MGPEWISEGSLSVAGRLELSPCSEIVLIVYSAMSAGAITLRAFMGFSRTNRFCRCAFRVICWSAMPCLEEERLSSFSLDVLCSPAGLSSVLWWSRSL